MMKEKIKITLSKYKFIVDILQAGINIVDKHGIILYVNDAYCKMHHYSREELIGKSIAIILPDQNPGDGLSGYKKIINQEIKKPFVVESYNVRKDSSKFPVLISWNYLMSDDELDGMVAVVQDISRIREVERALKASEQKYRSLVENTSDFIWEINNVSQYFYVSPKSKELYGFLPEDMTGTSLLDGFYFADNQAPQELLDAIENRQPFNSIEINRKKKNGQAVTVVSSGIPLFEDNQFIGYRGIDRDISDKIKVELINLEFNRLKELQKKREYLEYIMGTSEKIKEVHKAVERIARTNFSVLICGETGSGKEIISTAIHNFSDRENKTLVCIDCGAIPESLIESELFGSTKGAYTGSVENKEGAFQEANGGTLFLDEITNLSLEMQKKLLRVIQEREVAKIGSSKKEKLDIRIIAASNEDMYSIVEKGLFRMDLFYRLNEFTIHLPPLRERKEDIPLLVQRFIRETCKQLHIKTRHITNEAMELLYNYKWPGNVRELKNTIKRAIVVSDSEILPIHFDLLLRNVQQPGQLTSETTYSFDDNVQTIDLKKIIKLESEKIEKQIIKRILDSNNGNKSKTARFLQIDYKTMLKKIQDYNLE